MSHPARCLPARVAAFALAASPVVAAAGDPSTPVREAYRIERESLVRRSAKPPWRAPHRDRLFSKRLAALWAKDEHDREAMQDVGNLDVDPLIAAQDAKSDVLDDLVIDVVERKRDRAEVRARFTNFEPTTVRFVVVREKGRWVIDDILIAAGGTVYSVAKALGGP